MKRILTTLFAGLLGGPMFILMYVIYGLVYSVIYSKLIMPVALLYGKNLPEVPFYQWIIVACVVHVVAMNFHGIDPKKYTKEEERDSIMKHFILYISWIIAAYLINWIWL